MVDGFEDHLEVGVHLGFQARKFLGFDLLRPPRLKFDIAICDFKIADSLAVN